ncbi:MAG: hypothetical protein Q9183_007394 [Haloplaca sp. 2 TL-2023]
MFIRRAVVYLLSISHGLPLDFSTVRTMQWLVKRHWPAILILFSLLATLADAHPFQAFESSILHPGSTQRTGNGRTLFPRTTIALFGDDWDIVHMENRAAYLPHEEAANALVEFYHSLRREAILADRPEGYWFSHQMGRLKITFQSHGIVMPWSYVLDFANGLLEFTRHGYTGSYLMQFLHQHNGFVITVTMTIDAPPAPDGECQAPEDNGEVNQSAPDSEPENVFMGHHICWRP